MAPPLMQMPMMSEQSASALLLQATQTGVISPALAQQLHSQLFAQQTQQLQQIALLQEAQRRLFDEAQAPSGPPR
jgi:hypothetical protein